MIFVYLLVFIYSGTLLHSIIKTYVGVGVHTQLCVIYCRSFIVDHVTPTAVDVILYTYIFQLHLLILRLCCIKLNKPIYFFGSAVYSFGRSYFLYAYLQHDECTTIFRSCCNVCLFAFYLFVQCVKDVMNYECLLGFFSVL